MQGGGSARGNRSDGAQVARPLLGSGSIVELRRKRLTQARIASALGISASAVSRVLARAGLSQLRDLDPVEPVMRYEHERPGDLRSDPHRYQEARAHRAAQPPRHRRPTRLGGRGREYLFVAVDDHARIGFTDMYRMSAAPAPSGSCATPRLISKASG